MYFLVAPTTIEEQFKDSYDYIDSLYDGRTYITPADKDAYQEEVESTNEAGWDYEDNEAEIQL